MSFAGFFILMSIVCILVIGWVYVYLPETKGRPLEDMSMYFAEITGDRSIIEAEETMYRSDDPSTDQQLAPAVDSTARSPARNLLP